MTRPCRHPRLCLRTAIVLTGLLLAAACSDAPDREATGRTSEPTQDPVSAAPPSPEAAATPSPVFAAHTAPVEESHTGGPLTVTAVRVARQPGYDRVVFELDGRQPGEPGWRVEYTEDPRRAGSGDEVDVQGEATLAVLIDGTGYPFDTGQQEATSVRMPTDLEVVRDVELGAVFEGTYEAFVGVSRKAPFRVFRLADPARVVVDVRHE
ncbi:MAG: hypothetical protein WD794_06185 [Mycobacteriales bacterium]